MRDNIKMQNNRKHIIARISRLFDKQFFYKNKIKVTPIERRSL